MMLEWSGESSRVTVEAGGGPSIDTDQKVGGSNPSGRASQIRCAAAVSVVSGDLGSRSHPINCPIECGRRPLLSSVGLSIVVRTAALMRDAPGGESLRQRRSVYLRCERTMVPPGWSACTTSRAPPDREGRHGNLSSSGTRAGCRQPRRHRPGPRRAGREPAGYTTLAPAVQPVTTRTGRAAPHRHRRPKVRRRLRRSILVDLVFGTW